MSLILQLILVPLVWLGSSKASNNYISQVQNYVKLVSGYYQEGYSTLDFRPLADVSDVMRVQVGIYLYAINGFDEVAGNIELVSALEMKWQDNVAQIRSMVFDLSGKKDFLVPYQMIWTPKLILVNAIGDTSEVGDPAYMCRFNMETNTVSWKPRVVMSASCTPDVTYYPFDQQKCEFIYSPWVFTQDEIILDVAFSEWDLTSYGESGEWDIANTKTESYIENDVSHIKFTLGMTRKPLYFAFNILLPVLVLCLLNSTVFLLPAESGERVGFSVTCFLSFMVLLNMIMDIMPRSSSPISFLCFYLVIMMSNSGAMTLVTILLMRVYHKPEKSTVPKWLQRTVTFLQCGCAKIRCCVLCCRVIKNKCWYPFRNKCGCKTTVDDFNEDDLIEISVDKDNKIKEKPKSSSVVSDVNLKTSKRTKCQSCFKINCVKHGKESNKKCCFGCVIGFRNCKKNADEPQLNEQKGEDTRPSTPEVGEGDISTGCFCRQRKPKDTIDTITKETNPDAKVNGTVGSLENNADQKRNRFSLCSCFGQPSLCGSEARLCPDCQGSIEEKTGKCTVCSKTLSSKTATPKDTPFNCFGGWSKDTVTSDPGADIDNDVMPESDRYVGDPTKNKLFTDQVKLDTNETLLKRWNDATANKKANPLDPVEKNGAVNDKNNTKENSKAKSPKKTQPKPPKSKRTGKQNKPMPDKDSEDDSEDNIHKQDTVYVRKIIRDSPLADGSEEDETENRDSRWATLKDNLPGNIGEEGIPVPTRSISSRRSRRSISSKRSRRSRSSKGSRSSRSRSRRDEDDSNSESSDDDSLADLEEEVSWAEVGRILDAFFFLAFAGGQAFFTVVFLIPLFTTDTGGDNNA